ncbi:MAG: PIN domain-containing protein [Deltaproteobacteria bacterium]|nr:PIN domain-containing protein [Deltaproteobacteria bacterium]MBI3391480.1 PIN domain-containing protein [Deltaproteobacteria bacterium]
MRIYLNTSAFNRPFDDLSQPRTRIEAEAVAMLLSLVEAGRIELVGSEYVVFEASQNPDPDRARKVLCLVALAHAVVKLSPPVTRRARTLERFGLRGLDALHVAAAEAGRAGLLVTTDDRMIRRCLRAGTQLAIRVVLPQQALAELVGEERE